MVMFAGTASAGVALDTLMHDAGDMAGSTLSAVPEPSPAAFSRGYVAPVINTPVDYVAIPGGKFNMGTNDMGDGFKDAKPVHEVTIQPFQMSRTAVTVDQYAECVDAGACPEPNIGDNCNWGDPKRGNHPVNCVTWDHAQAYAKFKGARLPTEAEFEYAATSCGQNQQYPWGNAQPNRQLAVFNANSTMPVCSTPKGNTAQGLCDMSGNVWQWLQDRYHGSYRFTPTDGSAAGGLGSERVIRGGSFFSDPDFGDLRADARNRLSPREFDDNVGFRIAK
jgi:iron(II)-dependent oxidoreductase